MAAVVVRKQCQVRKLSLPALATGGPPASWRAEQTVGPGVGEKAITGQEAVIAQGSGAA